MTHLAGACQSLMLNHVSGCLCLDRLSWLQPREPGVSVASELTK